MLITKIHFEIEQLLQEQGIFNHRDFQHDEIDTAFNFVMNEFVTALLSDNKVDTDGKFAEINQYYTDVIKELKRRYVGYGNKYDNRYYLRLPSDYFSLISDDSYVYKTCNGIETSTIKKDIYYKVITDSVQYENKWYNKDDVFVGKIDTKIYPEKVKVLQLKTKLSPNRLKRSEDIVWINNDSLHKTNYNSPVSEIINKDLIVYYDEEFDIISVLITYYKIPTLVNYANGTTCDFSDNVCYYLIKKTHEHLRNNINQNVNNNQ